MLETKIPDEEQVVEHHAEETAEQPSEETVEMIPKQPTDHSMPAHLNDVLVQTENKNVSDELAIENNVV